MEEVERLARKLVATTERRMGEKRMSKWMRFRDWWAELWYDHYVWEEVVELEAAIMELQEQVRKIELVLGGK
jgi:hypothetical protein